MKKLLLVLMVVSSVAFADCDDPKNARKVIGILKNLNASQVQVNYTADKKGCADTCKANILALNKSITVNMNEEKGTGMCRFAKPGHD